MEKMKSLIPSDLRRMIAESTLENLASTCNSLLDFLNPLPQFQRVLSDLTDPATALCQKSKEAALDSKRRGNECFLKGDYSEALSFYSQALRHAPMRQGDMDMKMIAALFLNRASALHKMGLLEECLRDCNRAIVLSPAYAKAWYRRGKVNASLKNYQVAAYDLEVSLNMEGSPSGKKHIKEEIGLLTTHLNSATGMNNSCFIGERIKSDALAQQPQIILECVFTPSKGRGMASPNDIPPSSLIHSEEPLAAIINKSFRESHCHFCLNKVPADVLFCSSCTLPIYCSQYCQELAGGEQVLKNQNVNVVQKCLSAEHENHVMDTILSTHKESAATDLDDKHIPEHRHECGGAHWSAVLPTDIVLAGRVMMKSIERRKYTGEFSEPRETLDFAHNYGQISSDSKLELHIYAVVLSYCLQHHCILAFPVTGASVSQLVMLISQVKINSMAVVHMKSPDGYGPFKKLERLSVGDDAFTCTVEQVRVGQAIYSTGSFFNHSCQPNVHAYFISRTLFLRSTEFVRAWCPFELSYGPQVGQLGLQDREESLKEQYSFTCQCTSCSELNLSDLVINAFRCVAPDCLGAVSEMTQYEKLEDDFVQVLRKSYSCKLTLPKVSKEKDISKVASMLLQKTGVMCHFPSGQCLSCGSCHDLKPILAACECDMMEIERLKASTASNIAPDVLISDALKALVQLRSVRHPYSKAVAQAEDSIAEAFVRIGKFDRALQHCVASIEILEKLYHSKHIVIGHELMKLTSIQLSMGDFATAVCNIKQLEDIFTLHYGSDVERIFPYIADLRREADKLAFGG